MLRTNRKVFATSTSHLLHHPRISTLNTALCYKGQPSCQCTRTTQRVMGSIRPLHKHLVACRGNLHGGWQQGALLQAPSQALLLFWRVCCFSVVCSRRAVLICRARSCRVLYEVGSCLYVWSHLVHSALSHSDTWTLLYCLGDGSISYPLQATPSIR